MQNVQQLGQIMDEQQSYTPSINPFDTVMNVPPGYSMYQWQQELALARSQYLVRPAMAAWNLTSSSAAYAFAYSPLFSQMLPERYGAELKEINGVTKWAGGTSKWATRIGNTALNIEKASSAFASGIGTAGGRAVGWGAGQLGRGLIRTGEATANYLSGGFFTSANKWIGSQFGYKSGFFTQNISGYIDTAAAYANRSIDYVGALLENNSQINEAERILKNLKKAEVANPEAIREAEGVLKSLQHKKISFKAGRVEKLVGKGKLGLQTLTERVGGGIGNLIGAFFSPTVLLKQAVIDRLIDFGTESYEAYNTTMDLNREILAKGGRILRFGDASSITGVDGGLTEAQRNRLVSHIDRLASEDYTVRRNDMLGMGSWSLLGGHKKYVENLKELKALLSVSTDMGMLDMSRSLDEVEKRFDTIVKAVKKMSRITGKSKGELAMALASTQQSEARFDIGDAVSSLQRKIYAATLSGASLQTVLQEAALGSQMGVQAGLGKAAGADFMVQSRNIYQRMYRRRMLDRGDIDMMGGEQGVVSGIAAGMMSVANNDVFKSQLAMFFDTKTGRMDRSRLEAYINGEDVMGHAIERNLAMSRMSINQFTGVNEAGGKLRGRMMFVDRALQHGDISMNQIVGVARQLMKENRIKYGEAQAEYMMMGYFANTMGIDKAHLIMQALKDDSLMKPDIKEMMAVSRKQTEDRYAAEYQRATENMSPFWSSIIGGGVGAWAAIKTGALAGSGGGVLGAAIGAAVGLGVHYGLKNSSTWLGFGYNRMSPEMLRIHNLSDQWYNTLPWNIESGESKYKRYNTFVEYGIQQKYIDKVSARSNIFKNVSVEGYKESDLFKDTYDGKYNKYSPDIYKETPLSSLADAINNYISGNDEGGNELQRLVSENPTISSIVTGLQKDNNYDSLHNYKPIYDAIQRAREKYSSSKEGVFKTPEEQNKEINRRIREAGYIISEAAGSSEVTDLINTNFSHEAIAKLIGANISSGLFDHTGHFKGYWSSTQYEKMDDMLNYLQDLKYRATEDISTLDKNEKILYYAMLDANDNDYKESKKYIKSEFAGLTDQEVLDKAKSFRIRAQNYLAEEKGWFSEGLFGQSRDHFLKLAATSFNNLNLIQRKAALQYYSDAGKWLFDHYKDLDKNKYSTPQSVAELLRDDFDDKTGKRNELSSKLINAYEESKTSSGNDSSSTATTSETGGITSDSKLNMEILKTLRQLNATLMDMNQVNGRSNVYATSF